MSDNVQTSVRIGWEDEEGTLTTAKAVRPLTPNTRRYEYAAKMEEEYLDELHKLDEITPQSFKDYELQYEGEDSRSVAEKTKQNKKVIDDTMSHKNLISDVSFKYAIKALHSFFDLKSLADGHKKMLTLKQDSKEGKIFWAGVNREDMSAILAIFQNKYIHRV